MIAGSNSSSPPPIYYLGLSGSYGEGNTLSLYLDYTNAKGATVYWSISSDSATQGSDYTTTSGNYGGSSSPYGTGSTTVDYINYVADNLTEGLEYFIIKLGTYPGGNDIGQWNININDTSRAPAANYTIEWWQKLNSSQGSLYPRIFDVGYYPSETPGISFEPSGVFLWAGGGVDIVNRSSVAYDTWQHYALVRNSNTIAFYIDGINRISGSNNGGNAILSNNTSPLTIGWGSSHYWNGKITNFHWVKGVAKYTGNFTPLKMPTTAITTSSKYLLNVVDDANKLIDATGNHYLQSMSGTVSFDSDSPWYTTSTSISVSSNTYGGTPGNYELQFDPSNTILENVKNGWSVTNGAWSSIVTQDVANISGAYRAPVSTLETPPTGQYTFTPPAQTGSLVFNASYITLAASTDWAIDI